MIPIRDFEILDEPKASRFSKEERTDWNVRIRPYRFFYKGRELPYEGDMDDEIYVQYECGCGYVLIIANINPWENPATVSIWFFSKDFSRKESIRFCCMWKGDPVPVERTDDSVDFANSEIDFISVTGENELTMKFRKKFGIFKIAVFDPPRKFLYSTPNMDYDLPEIWEERHLRVRRYPFR